MDPTLTIPWAVMKKMLTDFQMDHYGCVTAGFMSAYSIHSGGQWSMVSGTYEVTTKTQGGNNI